MHKSEDVSAYIMHGASASADAFCPENRLTTAPPWRRWRCVGAVAKLTMQEFSTLINDAIAQNKLSASRVARVTESATQNLAVRVRQWRG